MNENFPNQVRDKLFKFSRTTIASTQENLNIFALEGVLQRLALSRHSNAFVLKGGMLLAAFDQRRATNDIDLAARSLSNSKSSVLARIREILEVEVLDGLAFDLDSIKLKSIRESEAYFGQRVSCHATLGSSRIKISLDINFGDELFPEPRPLEYPSLLPYLRTGFQVLAYRVELVIAEKFVSMLVRGETNTRLKDVADILGLLPLAQVEILVETIRRVAFSQNIEDFAVQEQLASWANSQERLWLAREAKNYPQLAGKSFLEIYSAVAQVIFPALKGDDK